MNKAENEIAAKLLKQINEAHIEQQPLEINKYLDFTRACAVRLDAETRSLEEQRHSKRLPIN